jgi:hypothetical protein
MMNCEGVLYYSEQEERRSNGPHPDKVLHHKLVDGLCRVSHVDFALAISEIRLHN